MKRTALALALGALSTTAAMADTGDAWYGTNRDPVAAAPTVTFVDPAPSPDSVTVYYDEPVTTAPVVVERDSTLAPSYDYVVVEPVRDDRFFYVEPRTYNRIGRDLFPRRGPNDFGQ